MTEWLELLKFLETANPGKLATNGNLATLTQAIQDQQDQIQALSQSLQTEHENVQSLARIIQGQNQGSFFTDLFYVMAAVGMVCFLAYLGWTIWRLEKQFRDLKSAVEQGSMLQHA